MLIGLGKALLAPVLTQRLGRHSAAGSRAKVVFEYARTRFIDLVSALAFAALLAVLGRPLLALLGDFQASYPLLLILSAGSIISGGFGSNAAYLSIAGHAGWTLVARTALLGLLVLLNVLLIPWLGALGVAVAFGLAAINTLMAVIIWRLDRVPTVTPGVLLVLAALLATERALWLPVAAAPCPAAIRSAVPAEPWTLAPARARSMICPLVVQASGFVGRSALPRGPSRPDAALGRGLIWPPSPTTAIVARS